ncbi:MGDG synthase family glycosyltransferase [Variovorax boronicumulans]|uniref:MGDG synthase family glycosyltransferase n=1 Tax=Variovorax boronicumulans TaxID=436515 RepID=UPI001C59D68C
MTQLLILSVSAGNGHVRAAQALAATAQTLSPPCTAVHIDAMAHVAGGFRKVYTEGYIQLVNRAPDLWSYLHQRADVTPHHAASQRLRRGIERLSTGALLREIRRARPDAVVCTHFLPAELLMRERRRGRIDYPVWLQITDYDLHNMWLVPEMTGYLAATEEVAFRLRARGIPAERIHVTGIPVMPAFSQPDAPALARAPCATRLGLDPAHPILLMASGGAGVGDLPSMVERVLATTDAAQVIAVAGRNAEAHARLEAMAARHPGRLVAIGFTDEMHKLMAAADLVVTKPGGLTVSECLALGRPMLLISPIPGQEEHNAGFLMEEGAAWLAYDAIGLDYKVARLMADRPKLARMAERSRALGKPRAAAAVLQRVLQRASA